MRLASLGEDVLQKLGDAVGRKVIMKCLPPVMKIDLFLTEACNLRCDYCFVATKKAYRRMSWEVAQAAVDFLMRESQDEKYVEIVLFGGEPLLAFPLMKRGVEYAEQKAQELGKKDKSSSTQNLPKSAYLTFWKPLDL